VREILDIQYFAFGMKLSGGSRLFKNAVQQGRRERKVEV
jgi:hypothetical protein